MADLAVVLVLVHGDQRRLVSKPENYALLIANVREQFPVLANVSDDNLSLHFTPEWTSFEVGLDQSSFHAVHDHAELRVEARLCAPATEVPSSLQHQATDNGRGISVHISSVTGAKYTIQLPSYNVNLDYLRSMIQEREGMPPEIQRVIFSGKQLDGCVPLSNFGIQNGSQIYLLRRLVGGKPAIYLLSPEYIKAASVTVELSEGWDFSALYPVVYVNQIGGMKYKSKITWNVGVDRDGYIFDQTGTKYTYLYWEAINTVPPYGQLKTSDFEFAPTSPALREEVSVVLAFPDVVKYLESTLDHLTLTTAMRQEFMTHWMPHFHKHHSNHSDIAIAFLPQKVYNEDAKLTVSPTPATIGRIFMLFAGVKTDGRLAEWDRWKGKRLSVARAIQRVDWAKKIGLDRQGLQDKTKFRVLEWGGMEVPAEQSSKSN